MVPSLSHTQGVPCGAFAAQIGGGGGHGGGVLPGMQAHAVFAAAPGGHGGGGGPAHLSGGVPGGQGGGGSIASRGGSGTGGMLPVSTFATSRTLTSTVYS